jgi:hypothetical protein
MKAKVLTPLKAIRAFCLECCGGSRKEVELCSAEDCSLWLYRFGKRPRISPRLNLQADKVALCASGTGDRSSAAGRVAGR